VYLVLYVSQQIPLHEVYVPKDGATHPGTQLGIHFFDCDQVITAAIARGDLIDICSHSISTNFLGKADLQSETIQHRQDHAHTKSISSTPMDDSKFCGTLNLLTLESARACINILSNFLQNKDHKKFRGDCFDSMWQRLKEQGAGPETKWRYDKNSNPLATCSWCFVPPSSTLGGKGQVGKDYFETEEQVVLTVLKEIRSLKEVSHLFVEHSESFSAVFPVLERAVAENIEYQAAKLGNR
jgi:hypothetical protein